MQLTRLSIRNRSGRKHEVWYIIILQTVIYLGDIMIHGCCILMQDLARAGQCHVDGIAFCRSCSHSVQSVLHESDHSYFEVRSSKFVCFDDVSGGIWLEF